MAERIFETIKKNPDDVKTARHFFLYSYPESTLNIFATYTEIYEHQEYSEDITLALQRVEFALDKVQAAFEREFAWLLKHHILELHSEIAVLEGSIEIEGG